MVTCLQLFLFANRLQLEQIHTARPIEDAHKFLPLSGHFMTIWGGGRQRAQKSDTSRMLVHKVDSFGEIFTVQHTFGGDSNFLKKKDLSKDVRR